MPDRLQAELHGPSTEPHPAFVDAVRRCPQCIRPATTRHQRHARSVQLRNCATAAAGARGDLRGPVQHRSRGHRTRRRGDINEGKSRVAILCLWQRSRSLEQSIHTGQGPLESFRQNLAFLRQ